ncbi:hypothetical protein COCON_G00098430 [Conger conger]|uniref:Uncharacterized protein n=1 Tax=Conger conger TaxID=82655 RepID=A0A9Q1DME8_CONCO|nr:hypothetical protein COCON_G00098430 [Conger conger]
MFRQEDGVLKTLAVLRHSRNLCDINTSSASTQLWKKIRKLNSAGIAGPRCSPKHLHIWDTRKIEPAVQLQAGRRAVQTPKYLTYLNGRPPPWEDSCDLLSERHKVTQKCNAVLRACRAVGMRLRGRDLEDSPVSWIPNILGVQSVRLRLRLDRRDNKGRGCWQLVDLGSGSEQSCRKLRERDRDRTPPALSQSPMSIPAASAQKTDNSEMQSPAMSPSFISGPRGKIPGRKRGRPPIRNVPKMDFQNRYSESLSPLKVPKKRGGSQDLS